MYPWILLMTTGASTISYSLPIGRSVVTYENGEEGILSTSNKYQWKGTTLTPIQTPTRPSQCGTSQYRQGPIPPTPILPMCQRRSGVPIWNGFLIEKHCLA